VRKQANDLVAMLCSYCPDIISDPQVFPQFYQNFQSVVVNEQEHPMIIIAALKAIANIFESFSQQRMVDQLNQLFVEVVNNGITVALQPRFLQAGLTQQVLYILNDLLQVSDDNGLKRDMSELLVLIVQQID
jgi:hypothetical protein